MCPLPDYANYTILKDSPSGHTTTAATTLLCFQAKKPVDYGIVSIFVVATPFRLRCRHIFVVFLSLKLNYVIALSLVHNSNPCRPVIPMLRIFAYKFDCAEIFACVKNSAVSLTTRSQNDLSNNKIFERERF